MPSSLRPTLALACLFLALAACHKKGADPVTPDPTPVAVSPMEMPAIFGTPLYGTDQYPVTEAGFAMGKALFYDPILSADSTISCGSCHHPEAAFSDVNHELSLGINNREGDRNSPAIQNMAWRSHIMWDGGISHLEMQPLGPTTNPKEMGDSTNFTAAVKRVARLDRYKTLTKAAFGSDVPTGQFIQKSLAQFMATLVSAHSRYDKYNGGDKTALTDQEVLGMHVFTDKGCAACHGTALFTDQTYRNNGLDDYSPDGGRVKITQDEHDRGLFLVPSLRNVGKTQPYMHDGRFGTLAQVIHHYRNGPNDPDGIGIKQAFDGSVSQTDATLPPNGIVMTDAEALALEAFLNTLTDDAFLSNPKYRP